MPDEPNDNTDSMLSLILTQLSELRREVYRLKLSNGVSLQELKLAVDELAKADRRPIDDDDWWRNGDSPPPG